MTNRLMREACELPGRGDRREQSVPSHCVLAQDQAD